MPSFEPQKNKQNSSVSIGRQFEEKAAYYLAQEGYRLLDKNWRSGSKEIDLIVRKNDTIVFVEVKAVSSESFGHPAYRVDDRKIAHLIQAAQEYILAHNVEGCDLRFDVITFVNGKLEHYPGAFDAPQ